MKSCYVVMRCCENNCESNLEVLTDCLYLAEKAIANYYVREFGEDGNQLVCILSPDWDVRQYHMRSQYKEVKDTFFRVFEQEIVDDPVRI